MDFKNQEDLDSSLNFKLHDFGYRGVSSSESAAIGGMAHLVSFRGTDTMPAISAASVYYGSTPAGFSVPASEHSTITSWGRESETEAIENMLDKYPTGPVACVMDSYSIDASTKHIVGKLKDKILARDGVFVVRPDSGDIKMTMNVVLNNLWGVFGGRVTGEGYKVLDPHIRVIQGDGMNYDSLKELLNYIEQIGFSTENVAFGMGGALLQIINRDTQKFAFKCSSIKVNGEYRDVQKSPTEIDANGDKHTSFKKSKPGKLALFRGDNGIHTVCNPVRASKHDLLHTVYFNGDLFIDTSLEDVRKRSDIGL
jgi:nicotinamide phosphoribosyltransferase